ncbi:hypothetical protein BGZ92_010767 [Podila epicladia]|nr:hypothetical protein BGZ92_010767 [Podila epicladia]
MSTSIRLPLECLHHIVKQLVVDNDIQTLITLLRVNKFVCLATLPFVYEDPFHWFACRRDIPWLWNRLGTHVTPMIRLFLRSIPPDSHTVRAIYEYEPDQCSPQHWPIDYLSFVRHFQSRGCRDSRSLLADSDFGRLLNKAMEGYINKHKLIDKYDKLALGRGHNNMRDADDEYSVNSLTLTYLNLDMFRETSWVLCAPILEQLKSIVIPLSDIDRYLDNVHRFPSLTSVTFKLDDLGDIADYAVQRLDLADLLKAQQWMEKRRQDLESAVQFVQYHTVIFRGTLKNVFVPLDGSWKSHVQTCPASYLSRMLDFVQSLTDPKELNDDNLSQFATKIEATNVEHVQSICFLSLYHDWYQKLQSTPFLHRCQSLRSLGIPTLGPDSFKWATRNQEQNSSRVPLKEVSIWAEFEPLGNELNDIGRGLGTLEVFKIQGFPYRPQNPPIVPPIKLGHGGWRLPFLSILIVNSTVERVMIDPDLLCQCPSLEIVSLSDYYLTANINSELQMCRPAQLPALTNLQLGGSPATCFHPDTLKSTKKLAMLVLGGPHGFSRVPCPSFFQLQEQSQQEQSHAGNTIFEDSSKSSPVPPVEWTFSWFLPNLDSLTIHVEFAGRFKFTMLAQTPNLRDLCLSIYSDRAAVHRELSILDFLTEAVSVQDFAKRDAHDPSRENSLDPEEGYDLRSQSARTLDRILLCLKDMKSFDESPPTFRKPPNERLNESESEFRAQLQSHSHKRLMWREPCFSPLESIDNRKYTSEQEEGKEDPAHIEETIRAIEGLVRDDHSLRNCLDRIFEQQRIQQQQLHQRPETLQKFEGASIVRVPSLKKLDLYGHWKIPEMVLQLMLGTVFRNVEKLTVFDCKGYGMDALVRATQSMPNLEVVSCLSQMGPGRLSDDCKLKRYDGYPIYPFEPCAAIRVRYRFVGVRRGRKGCEYVRDMARLHRPKAK